VGAFGEHLRREREMRGISLDEIVATTKIGRRLLRALEDEQFELLPGGIFNKAYVRAYAKCVGMDEEKAVAEYLEAAKESPPDTRVIAQQHASLHSDRPRESTGFPVVPVLILLVVATGGAAGWKAYQDHRYEKQLRATAMSASEATQSPSGSTSQAASGNATTPPAPAPSSPRSATPVAANDVPSSTADQPAHSALPASTTTASIVGAAAAAGTFDVTVRPKNPAWVSIKSDGTFVVRGIIKPPDVKTIRASSQVVFFTGNAGAVEVSFNGKNVPLPSNPNEEQVLVFDSRGIVQQPAAQQTTTPQPAAQRQTAQ
jgi:cytoskeleton protein RodZ